MLSHPNSHELSQDKERRLSKVLDTRELVLCKYTLQPLELGKILEDIEGWMENEGHSPIYRPNAIL